MPGSLSLALAVVALAVGAAAQTASPAIVAEGSDIILTVPQGGQVKVQTATATGAPPVDGASQVVTQGVLDGLLTTNLAELRGDFAAKLAEQEVQFTAKLIEQQMRHDEAFTALRGEFETQLLGVSDNFAQQLQGAIKLSEANTDAIANLSAAGVGLVAGGCEPYPTALPGGNGKVAGHGTNLGAVRVITCEPGAMLMNFAAMPVGGAALVAVCEPTSAGAVWSDKSSTRCVATTTATATSRTTSITTTTTTSVDKIVFNSWDVDFANKKVPESLSGRQADLLFYESSSNDVTTPITSYSYYIGYHNEGGEGSFNRLRTYWSVSAGHRYGYWGLSTLPEGSTPVAGGAVVMDNGAHPPSDGGKYTVLRFVVPSAGSYSVDLFGGKRKPTAGCGDHSDLGLYVGNTRVKWHEDLTKAHTLPTEASGNEVHTLGALSEGDTINFVIHHSNGYNCDANFVRWRITGQ